MNKKIQILRAIAILAVVVIHTYNDINIGIIIRPFVNYAVAIFIFISGFLTKDNITDYKSFILKRLKRVLIPFILWTVIYSIAYKNYNVLLNILLARTPSIFYYIIVYIQLTIITPLAFKLLKSKYKWIGFLITPISIFITRYLPNIFEFQICEYFSSLNCFQWFIFYYIGLALGNNIMKSTMTTKKIVIFYVISLVFSIIEGVLWYKLTGNNDMATTQLRFSSILNSIIVCLLSEKYIRKEDFKKENKIQRFLILIGNYSFGIYLIHMLINGGIQLVCKKIIYDNLIIFPINTILVFMISFIIIFICNKVFDKKINKYIGFI